VAAVRTVDQAAAWLERVGLALLFPKPDIVLPSLWEAVAGHTDVEWAERDEEGGYVSFTPEMNKVWRWKDELPERKLACVGLHVVRTTGLIAPALVRAAYALTGRRGAPDDFRDVELEPLERELAEAALDLGRPTTRRELRLIVDREKRDVDRAVNLLQRKLIFTNAGVREEESGWSSTQHDLFPRRWRVKLRKLPSREDALAQLAEKIVVSAGDVSAADLAAALRIRRREATAVLDALAERGIAQPRDEDGITVWVTARRG
jgi:hypothetical protein